MSKKTKGESQHTSQNPPPQQHKGSLNILNLDTHKQEGFRLYTFLPIQHHEKNEQAESQKPEIRFKANKKMDGKSIGRAIKEKNSFICHQAIMNIVNKILLTDLQLTKHKHKTIINELWNGLNNNHKKDIIKQIYTKKPQLLMSKESVYKSIIMGNNAREFFDTFCQNYPLSIPSTVAPENASRIIFINDAVYAKRQGHESVAAYIKKHPNECCIAHNKSALEKILNLHQEMDQSISLIIFADNNSNKKRACLDWTLETAGDELGKIVKTHPCIGHLNLVMCYGGWLDTKKLSHVSAYEKSRGEQDLSRTLSVYPTNTLPESNLFEQDTIAHQICQAVFPAVHDKKRGPIAISVAPRYIHNQESRFIGSSQGTPYFPHSFSSKENSLLHYKRITLFIGEEESFQGVCLAKSKKQKKVYAQGTFGEKEKNINIGEKEQPSRYGFFKHAQEKTTTSIHTNQNIQNGIF